MFGLAGSPVAYALRDFFQRSSVEFAWVEISSDDDAERLAAVNGMGDPRPHLHLPMNHGWSVPAWSRSRKSLDGLAGRRAVNTMLQSMELDQRA